MIKIDNSCLVELLSQIFKQSDAESYPDNESKMNSFHQMKFWKSVAVYSMC